MENNSILNQMAAYDFNLPIDVTMIFEDSDDETTYKNVLRESSENIHDNNNKEESIEKCISERFKFNKNNEIFCNNEYVNKSKHTTSHQTNPTAETFCKTSEEIMIVDCDNLCNNDKIIETNKITKKAKHLDYQNETVFSQETFIVRDETEKATEINTDSTPVIHYQINDNEPVTTFIEDMLNKLSEHIILIMQSFYHYRQKNNTFSPLAVEELRKRKRAYNFIKSHFFELSYTTIETIILPHEKNVNFIKQFLDNTVLMANNKLWKWNFSRRHVVPFFNELVMWVKQKRAQIKTINQHNTSSENYLLKQHLGRPPQPPNIHHLKTVPNNDNVPTSTAQNNLCIFSTGTPGSEIVINITSDTLKNCAQRQYNNIVEYTGHVPSINRPAPRLTPPPPYEDHRKEYQMNNYVRRQQSVAGVCRQNTKITKNMNNPRTKHIGHASQNSQNFGPPIQNDTSQVQYVNPSLRPCDSGFISSCYDNRNYTNQMHGAQIEKQISSSPIITNITSLNPNANTIIESRCIVCGKYTETKCSKCFNPSYCSYLCQELDTQFHKST